MRSLLHTILIAVFLIACGQAFAQDTGVLIICGDQLESTLRTIKGVKQGLKTADQEIRFETLEVSPGSDETAAINHKVEEFRPDVVVTVGTRCTRLARTLITDIPIVFASVLNPVTSGFVESFERPGEMLTGASLDISVEIQLEKFMELVPIVKKIGVLYSDRTSYIVEQAEQWASKRSVEIVAYEVKAARDVPTALESVIKSCDGLWTIPDELIFTPQSTKHILLESFRNRIPVMGFSPNFVKSGALFALSVDHKFIGLQAGELIVKVLNGIRPADLPVTTPEAPYLYINRNTAEKLRLNVDPVFFTVAKEVFE
jgi:putative ABC transport system substrate-binding protein